MCTLRVENIHIKTLSARKKRCVLSNSKLYLKRAKMFYLRVFFVKNEQLFRLATFLDIPQWIHAILYVKRHTLRNSTLKTERNCFKQRNLTIHREIFLPTVSLKS
jgi:hypothetical protein